MKTVIAVKDKVAASIMKEDQITEAGIVLLDTVVTEPQLTCKVMSKGDDVTPEINVGDIIYCHRNAGMDILVQGKAWKILTDGEIYAIVSNIPIENINIEKED